MAEGDTSKICSYCGGELEQYVRKCKHCGEWVNGNESFPKELDCFNWGAFLMNWIWGIMHKKYLTLLYFPACIIPIFGPLIISIWFGNCGNKWAWQSRRWDSIEQFNEVQKQWVRVWFVLFIFSLIIVAKLFFVFAYIGQQV